MWVGVSVFVEKEGRKVYKVLGGRMARLRVSWMKVICVDIAVGHLLYI